jgi:hypothetical protein
MNQPIGRAGFSDEKDLNSLIEVNRKLLHKQIDAICDSQKGIWQRSPISFMQCLSLLIINAVMDHHRAFMSAEKEHYESK